MCCGGGTHIPNSPAIRTVIVWYPSWRSGLPPGSGLCCSQLPDWARSWPCHRVSGPCVRETQNGMANGPNAAQLHSDINDPFRTCDSQAVRAAVQGSIDHWSSLLHKENVGSAVPRYDPFRYLEIL